MSGTFLSGEGKEKRNTSPTAPRVANFEMIFFVLDMRSEL